MQRFFSGALFFFWASQSVCSPVSTGKNTNPPGGDQRQKVIVLGIDGLGSENVWRETWNGVEAPVIPNLEYIRTHGSHSLRAGIDERNFSGPNWMGMLTGSSSSVHGVVTNDCERGNGLPTIFSNLKNQKPHLVTALVFEWHSIGCYPAMNTVDHYSYSAGAGQTASEIIRLLKTANPDFIFVDFDEADVAGHQSGGNSQHYKEVMEKIDAAIGRVLRHLDESGQMEHTWIILTADHGHRPEGGGHSSSLKPVPFFLMGPGVAKSEIAGQVFNRQVAPLVSLLMGTVPEADWESGAEVFRDYLVSDYLTRP